MNEWSKCNFCSHRGWYSECIDCYDKEKWKPDADLIILKMKEEDISVTDVIKLIEYCGD